MGRAQDTQKRWYDKDARLREFKTVTPNVAGQATGSVAGTSKTNGKSDLCCATGRSGEGSST